MKPNIKQLEDFIKFLPEHVKSLLLYGSDNGVINDRLSLVKYKFLGNNISEFAIIKYEYSFIQDQPHKLVEEINNYSFGIFKKIIVIYNSLPSIDKVLKNILQSIPEKILVIFLAEDLAPSSTLRKFFEEEENLAAIPNYIDEISVLKTLANNFLKDKGYSCDLEFINFFCESMQGNRNNFIQELEKITFYQNNNKHIMLKDVIDIIPRSFEENLENFWLDLMIKKRSLYNNDLESLFNENSSISLLRSFSNLVVKHLQLHCLLKQGVSIKEASKKPSTFIFFKHINKFEISISKFSYYELIIILEKLVLLEKDIKLSNIGLKEKVICFFLDQFK